MIDVLQFHGGWFSEEETQQVLEDGGLETYRQVRDQGKVRFLGFSADGPSAGVERMIATGEFDVMQIHYNLMYQNTCDAFGNRGVIPAAKAAGYGNCADAVNDKRRLPETDAALFLQSNGGC